MSIKSLVRVGMECSSVGRMLASHFWGLGVEPSTLHELSMAAHTWQSQHWGSRGRGIRRSRSCSTTHWTQRQPENYETLSQTKQRSSVHCRYLIGVGLVIVVTCHSHTTILYTASDLSLQQRWSPKRIIRVRKWPVSPVLKVHFPPLMRVSAGPGSHWSGHESLFAQSGENEKVKHSAVPLLSLFHRVF